MKTSGNVAIQPLDPLRRGQRRALAEVRAHVATILHSRRDQTTPTSRPPLEQPQLLGPSTATANKLRPRAAVREFLVHNPNHELDAALSVVEANGRGSGVRAEAGRASRTAELRRLGISDASG